MHRVTFGWTGEVSYRNSFAGFTKKGIQNRRLMETSELDSSSSDWPGATWKNVRNVPTLAPSCDHQIPTHEDHI